jgi:ATP-binding cassette, subfamily B, bacterial
MANPTPAATDTVRAPIAKRIAPLLALGPFLAPYRRMIALAVVALVFAASAALALPAAARFAIDHGFTAATTGTAGRYFFGLMGVMVLLGVSSASRFYLVTWIGERVVADIRSRVYSHILALSPVFFETTRTGEVLSRLAADTTLVQTVVGSSASLALRSIVMSIGALVLMAITSPKLTGLAFVSVPILLGLIMVMGRRVRGLSRAAQDRLADTSALAGETINAIQTVQAYTHEVADRTRYRSAVEDAFGTAIRRTRMRAFMTAVVIIVGGACLVGVLWVGRSDLVANRLTAGQFLQFVFYAFFLGGSVGALTEIWGDLQRAAGATERLLEILNTAPAVRAPAQPAAFPQRASGRVSFEGVDFCYPSRPDHLALHGFNLEVEPGEAVALVGPSGAGKSTVFQLLQRFYDPTTGAIQIDGIGIETLDPAQLRSHIAVVAQEPVMFSGTIAENIRYGRVGATESEVYAAATAAAADEFIRRLPEGYDTSLGERGITLSVGQRQRIAIARAILRDAAVLLLDEATSALDAENEHLVQVGLANLMAGSSGRGRTTLVIAHRLATIQRLRRIVVMNQGRIVAEGNHGELVRAGGLYARLAALQFDESRALMG